MPAKAAAFEQIKKLMGWCPCAKVPEGGYQIPFENFEANAREGREKAGIPETLYGYRKASTRLLRMNTSFTLLHPVVLAIIGLNRGALLAGLGISMLVGIFEWKTQMKRYDSLEKEPVLDYSGKVKLFKKWHGIPGYIFLLLILYLLFEIRAFTLPDLYSFVAGSLVLLWFGYLQMIYWERKNHKMLYFKSCGKWKTSYLIKERR